MNERILEILNQSGLRLSVDEQVKFQRAAALIVRECMKAAKPNYQITPSDSIYYVERAVDRIAEHFGVK